MPILSRDVVLQSFPFKMCLGEDFYMSLMVRYLVQEVGRKVKSPPLLVV